MHLRLPLVLLSALAVAAPGAMAYGKDKDKDKNKDKGKSEQRSGDRSGDRSDGDHHPGDHDRDGKITICHIPPGNSSARHTIRVGESAWSAHQGHGDHRGACRHRGTGDRRFDQLDTDDDGVIEPHEWPGDKATFNRLDRDDDGVISRGEFSRR
jgi:hypothetical protein